MDVWGHCCAIQVTHYELCSQRLAPVNAGLIGGLNRLSYDSQHWTTLCILGGSGHIHVEAAFSRGGMGLWGLESGAPIVCFKAADANGVPRGWSRELGRGGAVV